MWIQGELAKNIHAFIPIAAFQMAKKATDRATEESNLEIRRLVRAQPIARVRFQLCKALSFLAHQYPAVHLELFSVGVMAGRETFRQ